MSNLYPGGCRKVGGRVFSASNIARACRENARRHLEPATTSIADHPHKHEREIARRRRQEGKS